MAKMIQLPYDNHITLPIATAQAVQKGRENPLSLEALGLLANLLSYPSTWELHKTELYTRFAFHGERSVKSAWNSLMKANYIIEFKYRKGKKNEYVYYFRKVPFTEEEKAQILENAKAEYGEIFELCVLQTSKRRGNQKNILNKKNINNNNINNNINYDDDKPLLPDESNSTPTKENINFIIDKLREETKNDLKASSFNAIVRKVVSKFNNGEIKNFESYLNTAIIKKIEELEARREKTRLVNELKEKARLEREKQPIPTYDFNQKIPTFNWKD